MDKKMASDSKKSNANAQIQQNLQKVYDEALQEEIPNEFLEMIERLKAQKKAKSDGQ